MSLARLVVTAVRVEGRTKAEVSRDYGVSPRWVFELCRRFDAEGEDGLEPRSRRPWRSPLRTPIEVEDEIVELRKGLLDQGLDAGAHTIAVHLGRRHGAAGVPWGGATARLVSPPSRRSGGSWYEEASSPLNRKSGRGAPTCGLKPRCRTSAGRPTSPIGGSETAPRSRS